MTETPAEKVRRVGHCDTHWHWHDPDPENGLIATSSSCNCTCEEEELPMTAQANDQVYIVFSGVPKLYPVADDVDDGYGAYADAEAYAATRAEETQKPHTIMRVPQHVLLTGLTAVYTGVTIMPMEDVDDKP